MFKMENTDAFSDMTDSCDVFLIICKTLAQNWTVPKIGKEKTSSLDPFSGWFQPLVFGGCNDESCFFSQFINLEHKDGSKWMFGDFQPFPM